ncbi:DEAD/DEAH box helicase [Oceanirhabdus seepicola]|uniref:ATP-dependent RNA helicase CshA n=1 Tax=Oceanirhabdus seepicola TaxID=2828781 RepID=A0A9J6P5F6_9CLOT|nr:DEAD/DEAH box helicase [Oceanirhabdus seepicola]MCM1991492.1 DEAD/DEAH box helicase [Oceanirhabdus seepicola]
MNELLFENLNCSEEILKAVKDLGFEKATPIQSQTIPLILEGKDVVGQAQTGTGKTAAFGIPALDLVSVEKNKPQALILCPTRELALQVSEELYKIGKYKRGLKIQSVFGGQSIDRQISALRKGVHMIVGTPGRVMDHIRRRTLKLDDLKMLILDEADEMLNMGFREDIEEIMSFIETEERQTLLFSATMPRPILNIINKYQKNPEIIKITRTKLSTPNISQKYVEVRESEKFEALSRLIDIRVPKLSIVFCNTKRKVDEVTAQLQTRGYSADKIHGDMKQTLRLSVINKFKEGTVKILVATDVAARGLDIDDVDYVFNYDVPEHEEYYVHRIGRTGRAGREGTAYSFVTARTFFRLRDIMKYTKNTVEKDSVPTVKDIEEKKTAAFVDELKSIIDAGKIGKYVNMVEKFQEEGLDPVQIAAALLKKELHMPELKDIKGVKPVKYGDTGASSGMVRMFLNIGKKHRVRPGDIVGSITDNSSISGSLIGDIDILEAFSFVEIPEQHAHAVLLSMKNNKIKGINVVMEPAKGKTSRSNRSSRPSNNRGPRGPRAPRTERLN